MEALPILEKQGLFVTATDTEVGKTVISCAIVAQLRAGLVRKRSGSKGDAPGGGGASGKTSGGVGVCKAFASDCRREREGLVNDDALALAHFADCRLPLDVINPIRFEPALAPGVAAAELGEDVDWAALQRAMVRLDREHDVVVYEGAGGLMVPIDPAEPTLMMLDYIKAVGYPVVVVARAGLGTLNHTTMTVKLLQQRGCRVAGIVMNGYDPELAASDPSITSNRQWMEVMTGVKVLAVVPRMDEKEVVPHEGRIDPAILSAVGGVDWWSVVEQRA